ncbi:hypothetical protein [Anaplasma phagocytophilum]|uniref:hypothetical protein n=1 Tax=Anaplasma phagocytophilum TaxID=948 RepID=UPI00159F5B0B|nr:hypothetical protein [Anaplasma phagocytophilum]
MLAAADTSRIAGLKFNEEHQLKAMCLSRVYHLKVLLMPASHYSNLLSLRDGMDLAIGTVIVLLKALRP